jgi:CRISPR type III-A-associated protein Csm2
MPFPTDPNSQEFVREAVENFSKISNSIPPKSVAMSQLRKIYNEVRSLNEEYRRDPESPRAKQRLDMLRPRIQYLCARSRGGERNDKNLDELWTAFKFSEAVPAWLSKVNEAEALNRVCLAMEAMVAYAKVKQLEPAPFNPQAGQQGGGRPPQRYRPNR